MTPEEFAARWRAFAGLWRTTGKDPDLLARALSEGPDWFPAADEGIDVDDDVVLACEVALVRASEEFDAAGYRAAYPGVRYLRGESAIRNFCRIGWKNLRRPFEGFDVWWYQNDQLDPRSDDVNPFVHYLVVGRAAGVPTRQPVVEPRPAPPAPVAPPRRVCLFAAYDPDGIVDDYVVDYLRELSRFADVYYLADGTMPKRELDKLTDVTAGAWAIPHRRYDFGAYSLLATDLVGWEKIDTYDELMLANDSTFLLRPLDEVFDRMNAQPGHWWALQAAKRDFDPELGHREPIDLAEASALPADLEGWDSYYRLHLSSYFLVYRREIISDPGFRARLSTVARQTTKGLVIAKYEIGLSAYLIDQGYRFTTYTGQLHPYHPLYTAEYFDLVREGFPLLKRNFITENPRECPDLESWQDRILALVPEAPVDLFERNIRRVASDDRLRHSLAVRTRPDGTVDRDHAMSWKRFRYEDRWAPKHDHWWAFPVCAYSHTFAGNERAVFDVVRDDPSIKKIILTRSRSVEVTGENVVVVPLTSREGQWYVARSRNIFVKHGPRINVPYPVSGVTHNFINLWHGIPLKRFGFAGHDLSDDNIKGVARSHGTSRAVIASSAMDRLAMSAAFHPVPYADIWVTGLPRNDVILRPAAELPPDFAATEARLRDEIGDRRLVMLLPTFKDAQEDAYFSFKPEHVEALAAWQKKHNAVLGIREHMADKANLYQNMLAPLNPIDLSSRRFPDLEVLYRVADAMITDYSSCVVDFMLTGRPVISFAYDYDRYATQERGLFYELDKVFPGPVCRTFDELIAAVDGVFDTPTPEQRDDYDWKRRIFHDHVDDQAARRVVQRVRGLLRTDET